MRRWLGVLIAWLLAANPAAQELTCPVLLDEAWANIAAHCDEQMLDSLCYGYPTVSVVFHQHHSQTSRFSLPGDRIPLTGMDWFSASSEAGTWGIARARLHAYPADSLDVQTAAMVFFGNVAVFLPEPEALPALLLDVEAAAAAGANLRTAPTTAAQAIGTAGYKTPLKAIGRSPDKRWVQVYADPMTVAWVSQSLLAGDVSSLPVVPADQAQAPSLWLPLQSFDFHSGIADAPCDDLPPSGILLQTPKNADPRRFEINGTRLRLRGAAFLQAQIEAGMLVHVLDGEAALEALDDEVAVNRGAFSRVPLDMDDDGALFPTESPAAPTAYPYHSLLNLPIDLLLYPTKIGLDVYSLVTPRPSDGRSPIAGMALDARCTFTVGLSGAHIRSQPDPEAAIIGVMGYRESAQPLARAIGRDGLPWWQLAESVWIRIDATVTGGDCHAVPRIEISEINRS